MGHQQKGKGMKRPRSWHRRGGGPDYAFLRAVDRVFDRTLDTQEFVMPALTINTVRARLAEVAEMFGWQAREIHLDATSVSWQFWWTPADDVMPTGHIATFPLIDSTDPVEFDIAVVASVGAMHLQYAARKQIQESST